MRVVVVGAGMGGLCAAIALRNSGHDVAVHEKVREFRPAGAAISVWSNGVKCLNYLGLTEQAKALGGPMLSCSAFSGLGNWLFHAAVGLTRYPSRTSWGVW